METTSSVERHSISKFNIESYTLTDTPPCVTQTVLRDGPSGEVCLINVQEDLSPQKSLKTSRTTIELPEAGMTITGLTTQAKNDERLKRRDDKVESGDLHNVSIIYHPGSYIAVLGSSFDFNSPLDRKLTSQRFRGHDKAKWEELRQEFGISTESLFDLDIIGKQWLQKFPTSSAYERLMFNIDLDLTQAIDDDIKNSTEPDFRYNWSVLPRTQITMTNVLTGIWEERTMFLEDLHHALRKLPRSKLPNGYFLYNANTIWADTLHVIPIFKPNTIYRCMDPRGWHYGHAMVKTLQSNADLLATYHDSFNEAARGSSKSSYSGQRDANIYVPISDSNSQIDQLIKELRKKGWSDNKIERELIKKTRSVYLTHDTEYRDTAPDWSAYHTQKTTLTPLGGCSYPFYERSQHGIYQFTDGITSKTAHQDRENDRFDQIWRARAVRNIMGDYSPNQLSDLQALGKNDDADALVVDIHPTVEWDQDYPALPKISSDVFAQIASHDVRFMP